MQLAQPFSYLSRLMLTRLTILSAYKQSLVSTMQIFTCTFSKGELIIRPLDYRKGSKGLRNVDPYDIAVSII